MYFHLDTAAEFEEAETESPLAQIIPWTLVTVLFIAELAVWFAR